MEFAHYFPRPMPQVPGSRFPIFVYEAIGYFHALQILPKETRQVCQMEGNSNRYLPKYICPLVIFTLIAGTMDDLVKLKIYFFQLIHFITH